MVTRKITQAQLSRVLHVAEASIHYYRKGHVPRVEILEDMASFFRVSVDFLLGRELPDIVEREHAPVLHPRAAVGPQPVATSDDRTEILKSISHVREEHQRYARILQDHLTKLLEHAEHEGKKIVYQLSSLEDNLKAKQKP